LPDQAHLAGPLLEAARRLLGVLLSCAPGLDLLLRSTVAMGGLLKALDPPADPCGPPLPPGEPPLRSALLPCPLTPSHHDKKMAVPDPTSRSNCAACSRHDTSTLGC
jgi:hypothetical protein